MTNIYSLRDEAEMEAYIYFDTHIRELAKNSKGEIDTSASGLVDNDVDAFRHAYVSGVYTLVYRVEVADVLGRLNEFYSGNYGSTSTGDLAENMDLWNNAVGRKYGKKTHLRNEILKLIDQALKNGELIIDLTDPRKYEGETSYIIDPTKPVIVARESETGRNEIFIDLVKMESFGRENFVSMIEDGDYPGYQIASIGDIGTPVSKPDGNKGNNLG